MGRQITLALILLQFNGFGQLNMAQLGYLDVPTNHATICNDVWGYVDELGNEYALVGTETGVSIVDVTVPANPTEVFWIDGMYSIWRDLKVYGDYAYVTTEADEGLLIIDLSPLPSVTTLPFTHYSGPSGNEWFSAHNLYEDNGYLYIFGAGRDNGGVIILDVLTDPLNPIEVGTFDNWYAHDGYVLNDTAYFANINDGFFSIVDITNKAAPVLLGTSTTPSVFTHNIWTSPDGNYAFTTDEVSGGYLGAYDVSDPSNIKFLDKIRSSPGAGIVPHNVHVLGNYIYTSYYADGIVVHDVTHPNNMIEVANFDTSPLNSANTVGCWGAYPFLPSGIILATDRQEGLFVLSTAAHQGAYLEGNVTELGSGNPLNNVLITIDGQNIEDFSNVIGDYATGIESTGVYDLTYFKILYYPQTISTSLIEGVITTQDVVLEKIPQYFITVTVLDAQTLAPIENADVILNHTFISHPGLTDINGEVTLGIYYEDNYDVVVGKWGFDTDCFKDTLLNSANTGITLYLNQGIYDDFSFDNGWTEFGDAQKGKWVREVPVGVDVGGIIENPFTDGLFDCGDIAFVTGNGSQAGNTDEVENGETTLISPVFDLTGFSSPFLNFEAFYYNDIGPFYPDDTLFVKLYNGIETVDVMKIHKDNTFLSLWFPYSIPITGLIPLTTTMQLILNISDYSATVNICEAGFDNFSITNFSMLGEPETIIETIAVYPNPFDNVLNIVGIENGTVEMYDFSGRFVYGCDVSQQIELSGIEKGTYLLLIKDAEGNVIHTSKQIKI